MKAKVARAFEEATSRVPDESEMKLLASLYEKHRTEYAAEENDAKELARVGAAKLPSDGVSVVDLAAWTSVARTLLNLHEVVTRN